ncbi:DUF6907 domain-containing protein [Streptomyces sp. NPDC127108]|uniref:DUF6907 domain-containing protein n=1 Tax=Streptomyces sp. NPDC127108 TaxID=3345361 RepID=UPI00362D9BB5
MTIIDHTPQLSDDQPVPFTVTEAGARAVSASRLPSSTPGHELVPAMIGATPDTSAIVYIDCPTSFCTLDHIDEPVRHVEDLLHSSDSVDCTARSFLNMGRLGLYLSAVVQSDPASSDPRVRGAHILLEADDLTYLTPEMAETLADEGIAFFSRLRQLARAAALHNQTVAADCDPDMDEALRRVRAGGES